MIIETDWSSVRLVLNLTAVVGLSAFLGWWLIGRHTGTDAAIQDSRPQAPIQASGSDTARQRAHRSPAEDRPIAAPDGPVPAESTDLPEEDETQPEATAEVSGSEASQACPHGQGWLYLSSEPPGASLFLQDEPVPGKTPKVIGGICAGRDYKIRVVLDGYRTHSQTVTPVKGEVINLTVELVPLTQHTL